MLRPCGLDDGGAVRGDPLRVVRVLVVGGEKVGGARRPLPTARTDWPKTSLVAHPLSGRVWAPRPG